MNNIRLTPLLFLVAVLGMAVSAAHAEGGRQMPAGMPPAYAQECATCHTAYPPGMLPARSWQRIMGGLDKHYGTDASLDPATMLQLGKWLQANAGTGKRAVQEPPQDRITLSSWFQRKHRNIPPAVWKLDSVRSATNCAACHARADQGSFDERHLQFPAGLDARHRRAWND